MVDSGAKMVAGFDAGASSKGCWTTRPAPLRLRGVRPLWGRAPSETFTVWPPSVARSYARVPGFAAHGCPAKVSARISMEEGDSASSPIDTRPRRPPATGLPGHT